MNPRAKSSGMAAIVLAASAGPLAGEAKAPLAFSSGEGVLELDISAVSEASPWFDQGAAGINIRLTDAAGRDLAELTGRSIGQVMTFSVCGVDLVSATVRSVIEGGQIAAVTEGLGAATWNARILNGEIGCDGRPVE